MGELGSIVTIMGESTFAINLLEGNFFIEIGKPSVINDGKSAIDIVNNPGMTQKSKTYETWLHVAREMQLECTARFYHTTTDKMMADSLTKVVDRLKFFKCRNYMMNI